MREIALDTETTGFDPFTGDRVIEIGCVEMFNQVRTGKVWQAYINPKRKVPESAFKVHGISDEFLKDKPFFEAIAKDFLSFIGDSDLVIHNAKFDLKFLNYELSLLNIPPIPPTRATDTLLIARQKFPGSPAKLDALCKRFAIDTSARKYHGALLDSELLADVYLELMGGRQENLLLGNEKNTSTAQNQAIEIVKTIIPARSFPPSASEMEAHIAFLGKIKNPLWEHL